MPAHESRTQSRFQTISKRYNTRTLPWKRAKVTKLHQSDSTSSNDKFPSYARSKKPITTPDQQPIQVKNETPRFIFSIGPTLSKFIYEGRPTTTKPTFVALPYLTSHSTFHECSRDTPCQPQASLHRHLTKPVVIISYSIHLERKITLLSIFITHWNTTTESIHMKLTLLELKEVQRPSKLVSTLPAPLPNRPRSYLYRFLRLRGDNLH